MKWPRQYTINCLGIILNQRFIDWVDGRIEERNQKMALERQTMIAMDANVASAFADSTYQSSKYNVLFGISDVYLLSVIVDQKGVGFSLLRVGVKRRRTK